MVTNHRWRFADPRKAGLALAALMLALAVAAPASAQFKGDFEVFSQCPLKNAEVDLCVYATSTSGELHIGGTKVSINKTITLQGGIIQDEETGQEKFVGAANGDTLSKTPLTVPGGLTAVVVPKEWPVKLQERYEEDVKDGLTGVTATIELVGSPGISLANLLFQEGVALSLPVRIKLNNVFLGNECFIGSKVSPVTLELTTGMTSPPAPNESISGAVGEL